MSLDRLKERLDLIQSRLPAVRGRGEEATKQALVLPMLDALGFDIWNPAEVCPEFDADFATKKAAQKERVDLAVIFGETPRIFIEVKAIDTVLDGHAGQLARYFNSVPTVSLGILTNGVEYRFYTDTGEPNILDGAPFFVFRLDAPEAGLDVLAKFHKTTFSPSAIRDFATELNFTWKIQAHLRNELDLRSREPSDSLVRWILAADGMYEGRATAGVVERFRPIVRSALHMVLKEIVRRSVAALDEGVASPVVAASLDVTPDSVPEPTSAPEADSDDGKRVPVTTPRELDAVDRVRRLWTTSPYSRMTLHDAALRRDVPVDFGFKDTTAYLGLYLNKPAWWFARFALEARAPWVGFNLSAQEAAARLPSGKSLLPPHVHAEVRVAITGPEDIATLQALFLAAIEQVTNEHQNRP